MCTSADEGPPPPGGACGAAGQTTAECPTSEQIAVRICAPDGESAPCAIMPVHGSIQLRAVRRQEGGTYQWSTTSERLTLEDADSHIVTVRAGDSVSPARNAETVRLVFTPSGCAPLAPLTHRLTVVRVRFSEAPEIPFGYDDMDNTQVHHVSVRRNDLTRVRVTIEGGADGADFDFRCDDEDVAGTLDAPGAAEFDLDVAGRARDRDETLLRARAHCQNGPECGQVYINVYKERRISASVAKVWDSRSGLTPGGVNPTALRFPNLDVADAERLIRSKYKAAVVHLTLWDYSPSGGAVDMHYDLNDEGRLTFEIGPGGPQVDAIRRAFRASGPRIVIVRDMLSVYYLAADANKDDEYLTLRADHAGSVWLKVTKGYRLGTGATSELIHIAEASPESTTVRINPVLQHPHAAGETIKFKAGGWSGDPIVIKEGSASEEELKWTIGHELGHTPLELSDVDSITSIMHYQQGAADHRLRYLPLNLYYNGATQNQWQTIDRD